MSAEQSTGPEPLKPEDGVFHFADEFGTVHEVGPDDISDEESVRRMADGRKRHTTEEGLAHLRSLG